MAKRKKKTSYYSIVRNLKYKDRFQNIRERIKPRERFKAVEHFIQKRPFTSFFTILALLLLLIILGNILLAPKEAEEKPPVPKKVELYKLGSAPKVKVQAQVEKSGVVKIVALSPGVVESINVIEGDEIGKGGNLISLASNYSGVNALAISAQMAGAQYGLARDTFNTQKELITKQRELADKNKENAEELRDISTKAADDTRPLLDLNQSLLDKINSDLDSYNATNSAGVNDNLIFQTKQIKSQLQSAVVQLKGQLRNLELQSASDKPPAELTDIQKEIALKQLDIQEKSLTVGVEIARLQFNLASVTAATMHPTAPFPGTVDRIYVKEGEAVNPGTVLLSLSGSTQHVKIIAKVPAGMAKNVSFLEDSIININGNKVVMKPSYISHDATDGQLYSIIFQLDDSYKSLVTDSAFITVDIPIGTGDTNNSVPFVPLDSIFQTQEEAYLYVVSKNKTATAKKIQLGQVQGRFVEVLSGLPLESTVILTRNVVEGDKLDLK